MIEEIASRLVRHGLTLRNGFNFGAEEAAPEGPSGCPAAALLLVGNSGAGYWNEFVAWLDRQPDILANPLDTWSREVIGTIAAQFGARAVSPSDRPYLPFQQWAMRAEGLKPSPLGVLMHPDYGLWHAYRGALLFDERLSFPEADNVIHLCDGCSEKPCLRSCPVDAYSSAGFACDHCREHVRGPTGQTCRNVGCLDRNACPYGADWRYPQEVQAFHMAAFTGA